MSHHNSHTASQDAGGTPELTPAELELLQSMFDAAREGRTEYLASAVEQGVPVNLTNGKGDTLLNLAAYHEHPQTVAMLLEHGADTERVSDMGFTALICAVFRGNQSITRMLLEAGARQDTGYQHAQDVAREFGRAEVLELLIQYG
ncbi:ankyrin repeat domain-containing protein [Kocuria sp.]|uniref:ankyrin repeat domain-containing protein n=1 Tax=Kocuria sp. TaxID=1871328 RepID=UPI0026DED874|nr:ankyrin repeat domain-containing protein [Kocuria sp.]MDO5618699.1 ankyrin repeat domain-containing protein [Kocuria sp.]